MKTKNISVIFIFTALFLGFSSIHLASATANDTSMMNDISASSSVNTNVCSTGVLDSQGLCSQPTMNSQSTNSQGGILASSTPMQSEPNTYWCKPGTTDSNLCGTNSTTMNSQSTNSQGGILPSSTSMSNNNPTGMSTNSNGAIGLNSQYGMNMLNSNSFGGTISPNMIGTNPNSICATGTAMQAQGTCVNSQGSYYSSANCNFGIDPTTNQCNRTMSSMPNMFSQGGVLSQGVNNLQGSNSQSMNSNINPNMSLGSNSGDVGSTGQSSTAQGLNSQTNNSPGTISSPNYSSQMMTH